jgi:hypothetical protein
VERQVWSCSVAVPRTALLSAASEGEREGGREGGREGEREIERKFRASLEKEEEEEEEEEDEKGGKQEGLPCFPDFPPALVRFLVVSVNLPKLHLKPA